MYDGLRFTFLSDKKCVKIAYDKKNNEIRVKGIGTVVVTLSFNAKTEDGSGQLQYN